MIMDIGVVILLYLVALGFLVAEIFIPSHGILTVAGLGFLVAAVVKTFRYGPEAGTVAILACLVLLPTFAYLAIKFWPHTPIGRLIAPENPVHRPSETSVPVSELGALVGRAGRATTPLRPVGIGEFDGRRVPCVAQMGMISAGAEIEAIGLTGGNLTVIEKHA
jgi:membrane-bound serine protease (ClpP class)